MQAMFGEVNVDKTAKCSTVHGDKMQDKT